MPNKPRKKANQRNTRKSNTPARRPAPQPPRPRPTAQALPLDFGLDGVVSIEETTIESFRGPLPHPDILAKYDVVLPGAADRIVSIAEREQAHRHGVVETALDATIAKDKRGSYLALAALTVIAIAAVLIAFLNAYAGAGLGIGDILGVVGMFLGREITDRRRTNEEDA